MFTIFELLREFLEEQGYKEVVSRRTYYSGKVLWCIYINGNQVFNLYDGRIMVKPSHMKTRFVINLMEPDSLDKLLDCLKEDSRREQPSGI